ncbi:MAG: DUF1553 domain-containing protein, partial [Planctomycetes bacterium]|nr:DUF1553 domain-containing protein [Planctomycetota bacterium]
AIGDAIVSGSDGPSKGGFRGGSGWSIAGDERKEAREAILIPIEPLVANETSILRVTLTHNSSDKFKSLIGRFRVSSTDDARVRSLLLPLQPSLWRALGPFPAADVAAAYTTEFAVEKDLTTAAWKKKYDQPSVAPAEAAAPAPTPAPGNDKAPTAPAEKPAKAVPAKPAAENLATMLQGLLGLGADKSADKPTVAAKPAAPESPAGDAAPNDGGEGDGASGGKPGKARPRRLEWQEHRDWRDGESAQLPVEGAAVAWFVSRKVKCEQARTMLLELDGGVGAKVWINGTLVGEFAPPPPTVEPATKPVQKPEEFDEESFFAMRGRRSDAEPRRLRLGLRAGDNHLVCKLIAQGAPPKPPGKGSPEPAGLDLPPGLAEAIEGGALPPDFVPPRGPGGGLSFRCVLKAEGDDLLDYETLRTLQGRPVVAAPADATATATPTTVAASDDELPKAKTTAERRTRAVRRWFRTRIDVAGRVLFEELERLQAEKERVESKLPSALVMEELKEPRPTHLFVRGDYRKKGERITATTPAVLPPMPADLPKNRLGLARWLVSGTHPLTARVTVNRYWQQFFGLGLVRTADDFGIRGAAPSHPELLDWLATEFVRTGWNVKQMHRLIALSATYRQTNTAPADAWARDPDNVWLARGPRQRLAAEMVRDQALFVSGLLVQKVGGESVKPFQPEGLWKSMLGSGDWKTDPAEKAHRRGLYVYWKRGVPYPSFTIFDAAKRETCTVTRTRTTTPLQALVTLNDPVQFEAGRALGLRVHKEGGKDDDARLAFGFRLVTSRQPEPDELTVLKSLLADQKAHFGKDLEAAKQLLGQAEPNPKAAGGKRKPGAGKANATAPAESAKSAAPTPPTAPTPKSDKPELPPAEAAAWAMVGCTLLNLDAVIRRG